MLFSHPKDKGGGEGLATLESLEAWVPQGVPTPYHCPAHPSRETRPLPLPGLARTCPIGPRWHGPSLSALERRQCWPAGESGVGRTGERLRMLRGQPDDTARACAFGRGSHQMWEWDFSTKEQASLIPADCPGLEAGCTGETVKALPHLAPISAMMSNQPLEWDGPSVLTPRLTSCVSHFIFLGLSFLI